MPESTIEAYDQHATGYEERWEEYLKHTHTVFLDHVTLHSSETLLDVSGGTGLLAHQLLDQGVQFKHLTVNDPSEQMLGIARRRLSGEVKVSFSTATAEKLPFEPASFDGIFCLNSFHFYSQHSAVLKKLYMLLKPGGRLYLLDWNREGWFRIVNQVIQWSSSEYINTRSFPEMEDMMGNSGFTISETKRWSWRYWKFFFFEGMKMNNKP